MYPNAQTLFQIPSPVPSWGKHSLFFAEFVNWKLHDFVTMNFDFCVHVYPQCAILAPWQILITTLSNHFFELHCIDFVSFVHVCYICLAKIFHLTSLTKLTSFQLSMIWHNAWIKHCVRSLRTIILSALKPSTTSTH